MTERPACRCHDEPMHKAHNNGGWRCAVKDRARRRRQITVSAGGMRFHVGYAPTLEDAGRLRAKIKREAPNGTVRNA